MSLCDLEDPAKAPLVLAFRAEVARSVRPARFSDLQGWTQGLSTGIQRERTSRLTSARALPHHLRHQAKAASASDPNATGSFLGTITTPSFAGGKAMPCRSARAADRRGIVWLRPGLAQGKRYVTLWSSGLARGASLMHGARG
jgi:hypothetical protein